MIATADTARLAARARAARPPAPEHDGPPIKEATGEIRERTPKHDLPLRRSEPSILVADLVHPQTAADRVAATTASDLAAAHEAIAAVVDKPSVPPPADAATPTREAEVSDVRKDAVAFSDDEKAFFDRAESGTQMTPKFESFEDLDEGYQPVGFWDRVFGRTKPKKK
jgi:hypothetical protein